MQQDVHTPSAGLPAGAAQYCSSSSSSSTVQQQHWQLQLALWRYSNGRTQQQCQGASRVPTCAGRQCCNVDEQLLLATQECNQQHSGTMERSPHPWQHLVLVQCSTQQALGTRQIPCWLLVGASPTVRTQQDRQLADPISR